MHIDSEGVEIFFSMFKPETAKALRHIIRESKNFSAKPYNPTLSHVEIKAIIPKEFVGMFFDMNSDFLNELAKED